MSEATEDPYVKALRLHKDLVKPNTNEVFVDLDSPEDLALFESRLALLRSIDGPARTFTETVATSSSPGHFHARVQFEWKLDPFERLAFQLLLGSDPKREILGLRQARSGRADESSVFFEEREDA